ncbi:MAG: hypothetical protein ACRD7E_32240, partial [Bryobacteraceae bacterium]
MAITNSAVSASRTLVLLAPSSSAVPDSFYQVRVDLFQYRTLMAQMQRLRGALYLEDGALEQYQLCPDGRHRLEIDEKSWHLLTLNQDGQVSGCARYLQHPNTVSFGQLSLWTSAMEQCDRWGKKLGKAVLSELARAQREDLAYVEVGGWAIARELRCTIQALRLALGTYSLGQLLGGCLGIATATVRNNSSSMLRRIGGRSLEADGVELPSYYDPQYRCEMEILRFRSDSFNPRYRTLLMEVRADLLNVAVICGRQHAVDWQTMPTPVESSRRIPATARWTRA